MSADSFTTSAATNVYVNSPSLPFSSTPLLSPPFLPPCPLSPTSLHLPLPPSILPPHCFLTLSSSHFPPSSPSLLLASQLNSSGLVSRYLQNPLKFVLSTDTVQFNHNVTVSWAIPKDEATHEDWIGQSLSVSYLYIAA